MRGFRSGTEFLSEASGSEPRRLINGEQARRRNKIDKDEKRYHPYDIYECQSNLILI